jgi:DNA invertase Pin-like site-specific DNA recombinase
MYVRKSTDEKGNQIRSIDDQIAECKEYAKRNGIVYLDILEEKRSAKESGKRPVFSKMLTDIQSGKYTGILAWHPDRLSRNMKEAGEVIDLVDKDIIRDMKFVSFTFSNDPSGKLVLGITFAMSKEYSDKLSVNVKRGNTHSLEEGNYVNKAKDGYYKEEKTGKLRPDSSYFDLFKEAFQMRLRGETYTTIADFINEKGKLAKAKSNSKKDLKVYRKQEVGDLMSDPIYCGVTVYGKKVIDFTEIYDFKPMITPAEFLSINKGVKTGRLGKVLNYINKQGVKANLMRGSVLCGECTKPMTAGITNKKKQNVNYFYYRCETKGCPRKNKSERAKVIIDFASEYIRNNFKYDNKTWEHYQKETTKVFKENIQKLESDLTSYLTMRGNLQTKSKNIRERLYDNNLELSKEMEKDIQADYQKALDELRLLDERIAEIKKLNSEKLTLLDKNEFLELMQKLPDFIKQNQSMEVLDKTMRKIFLNFTILRKKVINSRLNSPFNELFSKQKKLF